MSDSRLGTDASLGKGGQTTASTFVAEAVVATEEKDSTTPCCQVAVELSIIHQDDDIVVLNKPSGLRTVPGKAVGPEAKTRAHVRAL